VLKDILIYVMAAIFEIVGCYAFLMAIKFNKHYLWYVVGVLALVAFAWLLAKVDIEFAGRAYAVYGGIYIVSAVMWLWLVEKETPTQWDLLGTTMVLLGATIILVNAKS